MSTRTWQPGPYLARAVSAYNPLSDGRLLLLLLALGALSYPPHLCLPPPFPPTDSHPLPPCRRRLRRSRLESTVRRCKNSVASLARPPRQPCPPGAGPCRKRGRRTSIARRRCLSARLCWRAFASHCIASSNSLYARFYKSPRRVAPRRSDSLVIYIDPVVVGNVGDNGVERLKRGSWPTPQPSVICVELLGSSRQPVTDRLATHRSSITVKS